MFRLKAIFVCSLPLFLTGTIKANPELPVQPKSASVDNSELLTQIAIIAVGAKPPRRYENSTNGEAPRMLLPTPAECPPSQLYFKGVDSTHENPAWQSFKVSFNSGANLKTIASGKTLQLYKKSNNSREYVKYISLPPSLAGSRRIYFLIPSVRGKDLWLKPPAVKIFDLGEKSLAGKKFIFKNLSRTEVLHTFDGVVRELPPLASISYVQPERGKFCRLAARYGVDKKIIFNTAVKLDETKNRHLFVFYDANPRTNSGRSVGVFKMVIPEGGMKEPSG